MLFPWWIKYPNSNNEILNLDWLEYTVKHLSEEVKNFINLNTIKYADPILWDITSQYESNTVVIDSQTGDAYISVQAVPAGVALSRTEYWTPIFNYRDSVINLMEQITLDLGDVTYAPFNIASDRLIWINYKLFRTLTAINAGDGFVVGSNITATTIENELRRLYQGCIDITDLLRSQIATDLGEVSTAPANLSANKLYFINGVLYKTLTAINSGETFVVGTNISATTIETELSLIYAALVNEINTRSNDVLNLGNSISIETTNRINNDRFINNRIDHKKIICIGDSYLAYNASEMVTSSWGAFLRIYRGDSTGDDVILNGLGGSGFIGNAPKTFLQLLQETNIGDNNAADITDIVVLGGLNDSSKVLSGGATWVQVTSAIESFISAAHAAYPNARIHIGYCGWVAYGFVDGAITRDALLPYILEGVRVYRNCVNSDRYGITSYINNIEYVVPPLPTSAYKPDLIHPVATTSSRIGLSLNNYLNSGYALSEIEIFSGLTFQASGICTSIASGSNVGLHSNNTSIVIDGGVVGFNMSSQELSSAVSEYEVAKIPLQAIRGCTTKPVYIPCEVAIFPGKNGTYDCVQGRLKIADGTVYLTVFFDTSIGNYTGVTSVSCWIPSIELDILTSC